MADFNNSVFLNYVFQDIIGPPRQLRAYAAGNSLTGAAEHNLITLPSQPPYVYLGGGGSYATQIIWSPSNSVYYLQYGIGLDSKSKIIFVNFRNASDSNVYSVAVNPNRTQTLHINFFNDTSIKIGGRYNFIGNTIIPNIFGPTSTEIISPCSEFIRLITNNEINIVGPPITLLQPAGFPGENPGSDVVNNACVTGSVDLCSNVPLVDVGVTFVRFFNFTTGGFYQSPISGNNVSVANGPNLISVVLNKNLNGIDTFYTKLLKINASYYPLSLLQPAIKTNPSTIGGTNGSIQLSFFATDPAQLAYSGGNVVGTQTQSFPNVGAPPASASNSIATINGLAAGTYSLVLTDYCGLTNNASVTLSDPPPFFLTFDYALTPPDGLGCTSAVVTVNTNYAGAPDFHWFYPDGTEIPIDGVHLMTINSLTLNLTYPPDPFGLYTFEPFPGLDYPFLAPTPLNYYINDSHVTCGGTTGTLALTLTGGNSNATYTYSWHDVNNLPPVVGTTQSVVVPVGTYIVYVTDTTNNVCFNATGTMLPSPPLVLTTMAHPMILTTNDPIAIVFADVTGGTLPYTYVWTKNGLPISNVVDHVENATVGTYNVVVTDNYGCSQTSTYFLGDDGGGGGGVSCSTNVFQSSVTDDYASCNTGLGTLTVDIINNNPTPVYTYKWYNVSDFNTILSTTNSLTAAPGTYFVFVTDTFNGLCSNASCKILLAPPLFLTTSSQPLSLSNISETAIIISNTVGGVPPYTYQWMYGLSTLGSTYDNIENARAGTYQVTVTDSNGCTSSQVYQLNVQPKIFQVTVTNVYASCITNLGTLSANIINGGINPPNYSYNWYNVTDLNTVISTASSITVAPGTYYLILDDIANNLSGSTSASVLVAAPLIVDITAQPLTVDYVSDTALISANVVGGVIPYSYTWTFNGNPIPVTDDQVTNASPGLYNVSVIDGNGCEAKDQYNLLVVSPVPFVCSVQDDYASCVTNQGTLTVDIINGGTNEPNYVYKWYEINDLSTIIFATQSITVNPGTYYVTVEDTMNGLHCDSHASVLVAPEIVTTITSQPLTLNYASDVAIILANVVGGVSPFTYAWLFNGNPISTTDNEVANAHAGMYQVTVTDANACVSVQTYNLLVVAPSAFVCSVQDEYASCVTNQGTLTVDIINGGINAPNYVYKWYNINDLSTIIFSTQSITVNPGTYYVTVEDTMNGSHCDSHASVLVPPELVTTITSQPLTVDCSSGTTTLFANTVGGVPPYTYAWTLDTVPISNTGDEVTNAFPGTYEVTVTDSNTCTTTATYNLVVVRDIAFDASVMSDFADPITNLGSLTVDVINSGANVPNYVYTWYNINDFSTVVSTQATLTNSPVGTYYVYVEDMANGHCTHAIGSIIQSPMMNVTMDSQPAQLPSLSDTAVIFANVFGGVGPFTYSWKLDGVPISDIADHVSNATIGTYEVTVTDSTGHAVVQTYVLTFMDPGIFHVIVNNATASPITGLGTLVASVISSAINPDYHYIWYNTNDFSTIISTTQSITAPPGTYYVHVADLNNGLYGSAIVTITIAGSSTFTATLTSNPPVLQSFDDRAVLVVTPSGGIAPFTYAWRYNGVSIPDTPNIPGLPANGPLMIVNGNVITGADAGLYEVTVTDATNTSITLTYLLTKPDELKLRVFRIDDSFCGSCSSSERYANGELSVRVSGGKPFVGQSFKYLYKWYNLYTGKFISNKHKIDHLRSGTYQIHVTDQSGNTKIRNVDLNKDKRKCYCKFNKWLLNKY